MVVVVAVAVAQSDLPVKRKIQKNTRKNRFSGNGDFQILEFVQKVSFEV